MNNPTAACVASDVSAKPWLALTATALPTGRQAIRKRGERRCSAGLKKRSSRALTRGTRLRPAGETNLPAYKLNLTAGQT